MNTGLFEQKTINDLTNWGKWAKRDIERVGWQTYTNEYRLMKEGVLIASTGSNLDDDPVSEKVDRTVAQLPLGHKNILCTRFIYAEGRRLESAEMGLSKTVYKDRLNMAIAWFSGVYGCM